jgi:hypothetical protein
MPSFPTRRNELVVSQLRKESARLPLVLRPWFATAPILMFGQPRSQTLVLCFCATGALTWLAACASSDVLETPGRGGSASATGGGTSAGSGNSTAGTTATGTGGGTSSAGATAAGGAPASGGAVATGGAATAAGGAATGTGGTATGTAGASASGGSGTSESPPGFFTAGYLSRAPWMGYVFTIADSVGSTVSPLCDTTGCTPAWGTQACAKGKVVMNATSSGFAGLAFHANEPTSGTRSTWTSTGTGIYINIANMPALARLQLQEEVSSDDTRYCAKIPAGGGLIPFSEFKTFCWGDPAHPSKAFVVGTAVNEVTINIPGNQTADVPFDFCLIDIQPR